MENTENKQNLEIDDSEAELEPGQPNVLLPMALVDGKTGDAEAIDLDAIKADLAAAEETLKKIETLKFGILSSNNNKEKP